MPLGEAHFIGTNKSATVSASFRTVVGYEQVAPVCGEPAGQVAYLMKDKPKGYPNPKTPWLDAREAGNYSLLNSKLSLVHWQEKPGWHDEYLSAWGSRRYDINFAAPYNKNQQFQTLVDQTRFGSRDPEFPPSLLVPKFVGVSWGLENPMASQRPKGNRPPLFARYL